MTTRISPPDNGDLLAIDWLTVDGVRRYDVADLDSAEQLDTLATYFGATGNVPHSRRPFDDETLNNYQIPTF